MLNVLKIIIFQIQLLIPSSRTITNIWTNCYKLVTRGLNGCSPHFIITYDFEREHAVAKWLRYYATSRKVEGSIPDEVNVSI
jgi:hypothetical protein